MPKMIGIQNGSIPALKKLVETVVANPGVTRLRLSRILKWSSNKVRTLCIVAGNNGILRVDPVVTGKKDNATEYHYYTGSKCAEFLEENHHV